MNIKFINHLHEVLIFSILILFMLMLARASNVFIFGDWQDIGQSLNFLDDFFFKGFRFDLKLLSSILILIFCLPVLLFSWLIPEKWFSLYLQLALKTALVLLVYLIFVDVGYIFYFQKPIDVLIFGLLEDDTRAIFSTIFDDFNILTLFAGFIAVTAGTLKIFSKLIARYNYRSNVVIGTKAQLASWLCSFLILFIFARGSLDSFPLQRKHASVSDNTFLNYMVMNSAFNLYYAYRDKSVNNREIFNKDILSENKLASVEQLIHAAGYDEKQPLVRTTAANEKIEKARPHVIFILMEGWSSQIALQHSETNNVLGEFSIHAEEDHYYTKFFANKYATNPSIEALLINSPITPLSQSIANKTLFNLSNVLPFKKQNYQTLFLSGGYSSWRNHNNFWLKQGFDQYIGRSKIENHFNVDASDNPWGVYDEYLFEYLKKSLLDAEKNNTPLFSFVLTTNNHPPVRLPESYITPQLDLTAYGFEDNDREKHSMLTGFHYQTDQLGRFISWLKSGDFKDRVVLVATGDHPMRHFIDNKANINMYLHYSVPAYFYVPEALDKLDENTADISGSHNDLFPTLYELSLSKTSYYNFGQPLMEKKQGNAYGWAEHGEFIFSDGIADIRSKKFYPWSTGNEYLLNPESSEISTDKLKIIQHELNRRLLKKYLIVKDYQEQMNNL